MKLLPQHWFLWKEPARSQPAVASGALREHVILEKFIRSSDKLQEQPMKHSPDLQAAGEQPESLGNVLSCRGPQEAGLAGGPLTIPG